MAVSEATVEVRGYDPVHMEVSPLSGNVFLYIGSSFVVFTPGEWWAFQDAVRDVQAPAPGETS